VLPLPPLREPPKLEQDFLPQTVSCDLAVPFLDLDADGFAPEVFRGAERCSAAHEGVENGFGVRQKLKTPLQKR